MWNKKKIQKKYDEYLMQLYDQTKEQKSSSYTMSFEIRVDDINYKSFKKLINKIKNNSEENSRIVRRKIRKEKLEQLYGK